MPPPVCPPPAPAPWRSYPYQLVAGDPQLVFPAAEGHQDVASEGRTFERESGTVSIMLEAGRLWNGRKFVEQPLPYGTRPRLVMVHLSSEAIRTIGCAVCRQTSPMPQTS